MECQPSDSKKLFKVFDASKRKRTRKKTDDNNSLATDESTGGAQSNGRRNPSAKASLQDILPAENTDGEQEGLAKRDKDSSPESRSPGDAHRPSRSPRRRRRIAREGISLALKAGLVSTPRSISTTLNENTIATVPQDQDSFIYAFLEEAIKRDKKKHRHRHERRQDDHRVIRDREVSDTKRRHHHRRHREECRHREDYRHREDCRHREDWRHREDCRHREECRHREKHIKEESPAVDQIALFETFAKLCAQMNDKTPHLENVNPVPRSQSHKSLQCEVVSRRDCYEVDHRPVRLQSDENSREQSPARVRSSEHFRGRVRSHDNIAAPFEERKEKCCCCPPYEKQQPRYTSKVNIDGGKNHEEERYRDYPLETTATRSYIDGYYRSNPADKRDVREYIERRDPRRVEDRRHPCEQKTSRSFDMHRENHIDEDRLYRRTARSDGIHDKIYEDREYRDRKLDDRCYKNKYYEERDRERMYASTQGKDQRTRKNLERFERNSVMSRDEEYRDRYSERERDSGLSVADGETSTISGKSNYLKVVKQEISEQREAMDKMMKLWKELMRCFKGISQTQGRDKAVNESAATQLRLWRECMHRYETVARDVGDTDARLMEEINKQRSEMSEMASMWQECLQRYRDMSSDFNNLKQKLSSQSPPRAAEGDLPPPAPITLHPHYRPLHDYPPMPPIPPYAGSPLRQRASAPPAAHPVGPPAWWWGGEGPAMRDSRDSPDRDRRHRHRDRDDLRYKEKSSKPSGARSEHRNRKR